MKDGKYGNFMRSSTSRLKPTILYIVCRSNHPATKKLAANQVHLLRRSAY